MRRIDGWGGVAPRRPQPRGKHAPSNTRVVGGPLHGDCAHSAGQVVWLPMATGVGLDGEVVPGCPAICGPGRESGKATVGFTRKELSGPEYCFGGGGG